MEKEFNRAVILGCACVITSRFTVQEIDSFNQYLPEALELKEDGETVFRVELDEGGNPGKIEESIASYSRTKVPGDKATITIVIDPSADDKAQLVQKNLGKALLRLEEVESQMNDSLGRLQEKAQLAEGIIRQLG